MAVAFVSATPVEHELYLSNPEVHDTVDLVGQMICDLHDEPIQLTILLTVNDINNLDEYSLAFSGSSLSLEFSPDTIEIEDFNDGDPYVLERFDRSEVNRATTWLVNKLEE